MNRLNQADRTNGNQVFDIDICVFKFSRYVDDKSEIAFDEDTADLLIAVMFHQAKFLLR